MTDSDKLQNTIRWLSGVLAPDTVERIVRGEEAALDLTLMLQELESLRSRVAMLEASR